MDNPRLLRQSSKTLEQQFLYKLQTDYNLAPKVAETLLKEAQQCLQGQPSQGLRPGQIRVILAKKRASHARPVAETPTKEVTLTIDAGLEDLQVLEEQGLIGVRRCRVQRLLREALKQGTVASQEDLARVLTCSVRTIKRDFAVLKAAGVLLPSRGYVHNIGRGQTHKGIIVNRWLSGQTYDQIARSCYHSVSSVHRYVQTFVRTVRLYQQALEPSEIALILQIGQPLVQQYLSLYQDIESPASRERLQQHLQRLSHSPSGLKKGGL